MNHPKKISSAGRPTIDHGWQSAAVDEMLSRYVSWRESAGAVADAYERWRKAPPGEESGSFSAYLAALDLEESAAGIYALAVGDLEAALVRGRPGLSR
jgi:hypothetical protein